MEQGTNPSLDSDFGFAIGHRVKAGGGFGTGCYVDDGSEVDQGAEFDWLVPGCRADWPVDADFELVTVHVGRSSQVGLVDHPQVSFFGLVCCLQ